MRLLEPYGRAGAMLALMTVTTEPVGGPSVVTPAIPSGRAALPSRLCELQAGKSDPRRVRWQTTIRRPSSVQARLAKGHVVARSRSRMNCFRLTGTPSCTTTMGLQLPDALAGPPGTLLRQAQCVASTPNLGPGRSLILSHRGQRRAPSRIPCCSPGALTS